MLKTKRFLSIALALTLLVNVFAIGASAVLNDGNELSAKTTLQVGWLNGTTFTPLAIGEALKTNDVITVRICPQTDFYVGASYYVVMFDKLAFVNTLANKAEFSANSSNTFYNQTASGYAGSTNIPDANWPASFGATENYNLYKAIKVGNTADSNSPNSGYPNLLPGDWLFQFKLKVLKDLPVGSDARIWMDKRWVRSPANTTIDGYFAKCLSSTDASSSGQSTIYNFDIDMTNADLTIPLALPVAKSTISFNSDGGSAVSSITGNVGSTVTAPTNPTKEGFTFAGWDPALPATFPDNNTTVKALWNIKQTTISFDSQGGSTVASITGNYGATITAPADPTRENYTFAGWTGLPSTFPLNDITVTATWTLNQSTISFNSNGGTTVASVSGGIGTSVPTITDPTRDDYTFAGWLPTIPATFPATGFTAVAQWTINQTTITFDSADGTPVAPLTGDIGSAVTAPSAPTRAGYTFAGWNPSVPSNFPETNVTLTAQWNPIQYNAIFMVDSVVYETVPTFCGAAIVPPANPSKAGFTFTGWSPSVGTMGVGDETFNAIFVASTQASVTITLNGTDIGDKYEVLVPWYKLYSTATLQLGYDTTVQNPVRVEYTSSNKNVVVDQDGKITNTGFLSRTSDITVNIYDASDNIIATDTVNVKFYKFSIDSFIAIIKQFLSIFGI